MPLYDYRCSECEFEFANLKKVDERKLDECPKCASIAHLIFLKSAKIPIGKMGCDSGFPTAYAKWEKMQRSKNTVGGMWDSNNERYGGYHEKK
jgi:putative FmdB family regulatory protein